MVANGVYLHMSLFALASPLDACQTKGGRTLGSTSSCGLRRGLRQHHSYG